MYRDRIYARYISSSPDAMTGETALRARQPYLNHIIRHHFPANRQALIIDLGCGSGALIHYARRAGYHNTSGVDRSPQQVALAHASGIEGVREADLWETLRELPDRSHDGLVTFDVIEHFAKDELIAFADEVVRVLKPGGLWIIHAPNGESPFGANIRYSDFTHELAFTRRSIQQLLLACGFAEVHVFEDTPVPHGAKSAVRWVLWKFVRALLRLYLVVETGDTGRDVVLSQNLLAVGRL